MHSYIGIAITNMNLLQKILPTVTAEAHCDIPCGIYDPTPAKIAAVTVLRMVLQLGEFKPPEDMEDSYALNVYHNSIMRRIKVKEDHCHSCEDELHTLWVDFFRQEHFEKYPRLHEMFWSATELCSKNRQGVDEEAARALNEAVDEIARIFYEVKGAQEKYEAYKTLTAKMF